MLTINPNYSSRRLKFKLPAVQSTKQAEKEVESVNHTVAQDRKYYVECAVVRIMKTRKVLRHTQLVNEVRSFFFNFQKSRCYNRLSAAISQLAYPLQSLNQIS